jgi:hypothetical protein
MRLRVKVRQENHVCILFLMNIVYGHISNIYEYADERGLQFVVHSIRLNLFHR